MYYKTWCFSCSYYYTFNTLPVKSLFPKWLTSDLFCRMCSQEAIARLLFSPLFLWHCLHYFLIKVIKGYHLLPGTVPGTGHSVCLISSSQYLFKECMYYYTHWTTRTVAQKLLPGNSTGKTWRLDANGHQSNLPSWLLFPGHSAAHLSRYSVLGDYSTCMPSIFWENISSREPETPSALFTSISQAQE